MTADDELWLALHDNCGPYGCGNCVMVDLELSSAVQRDVLIQAHRLGMSEDAYMLRCIRLGLEALK